MRVYVESTLPCDAELAWAAVQTSELLEEVCAPLIYLQPQPGEQMPVRWATGSTVRLKPSLFGVLPLPTRSLHWERIDDGAQEMQTREFDALIRLWDHRIQVQSAGKGRCRYTDDVEVNAGLLTPLAWLFAQCLYRHRHRRWKRAAARMAEGGGRG